MSYYKKYIKYKSKYLDLKNKINQIGGKIFKTISNSGSLDGMTFQCFWISILQYLTHHGYPLLTLRELRTRAGLDNSSEHIMFDTWATNSEGRHYFMDAANRIARMYHINIQVYIPEIHDDDTIHINEQPTYFFPIGKPVSRYSIVRLVNFGIHFELIDDKGSDYVPLVSYKGEAKKITEVPVNEQKLYLKNSEDALLLKTLEYQRTKINKEYIKELQSIDKLAGISNVQKEALKEETKSKIELDNITKIIKQVKERIKKEEHDIKKIELTNLQDILTQQQKHLKEEEDMYTTLRKTSTIDELKPLQNLIVDIQRSITETVQIIANKNKELRL